MKYEIDRDGFMSRNKMNKCMSKIEHAILETYGYDKDGEELFDALLEMRGAWGASKVKRQLENEENNR